MDEDFFFWAKDDENECERFISGGTSSAGVRVASSVLGLYGAADQTGKNELDN